MRLLLVLTALLGTSAFAATHELLVPTPVNGEPSQSTVDGLGGLRLQLDLGTPVEVLLDAQSLTDRALLGFGQLPETMPVNPPMQEAPPATVVGLAQGGFAGFETLTRREFVVRDPHGQIRWHLPATAAQARADGSAGMVIVRETDIAYCEIAASGSQHWCRSLGPYPQADHVQIGLDATGGAVIVWEERFFFMLSTEPRRILAARVGAAGELRWEQEIGADRFAWSRAITRVGDDALLSFCTQRGFEIARIAGADGALIWRRILTPPLEGAFVQVVPDADGVWLFWVSARSSFALERIDARGARSAYVPTPGVRDPVLLVFPGIGIAIYSRGPSSSAAQLNWHDSEGHLIWRKRYASDERIGTITTVGHEQLLVGLRRGVSRPVPVIEQLRMRDGRLLRDRSFDRVALPAIASSLTRLVGSELWIEGATREVASRSILFRVSSAGVNAHELGPRGFYRIEPVAGNAETAAFLFSYRYPGYTVIDAAGRDSFQVDLPLTFRRLRFDAMPGDVIQGLIFGSESGNVRYRWNERTGALIDRTPLQLPAQVQWNAPISRLSDGSLLALATDRVLRIGVDGGVIETASLAPPECEAWSAGTPFAAGGFLAETHNECGYFDGPPPPPDTSAAWIEADGRVRWQHAYATPVRAVTSAGSRLYALNGALPLELDPRTGAIVGMLELPGEREEAISLATLGARLLMLTKRPIPDTWFGHEFTLWERLPQIRRWCRWNAQLPPGQSAELSSTSTQLYVSTQSESRSGHLQITDIGEAGGCTAIAQE